MIVAAMLMLVCMHLLVRWLTTIEAHHHKEPLG